MRIRILLPIRGGAYCLQPGDVFDHPDEVVARAWIRTHHAEAVQDGAPAAVRRDRAQAPPAETRRPAAKRGKR